MHGVQPIAVGFNRRVDKQSDKGFSQNQAPRINLIYTRLPTS
jgi:hypothetical protein